MRRRILLLVVGMTVLVVLAFAIPLAVLIRSNSYNSGVADVRKETTAIALYLNSSRTIKTKDQITTYLAGLNADRSASVELPDAVVVGRQPPGEPGDIPTPPRYQPGSASSAPPSTGEGGGFGVPGRGGDLNAVSYRGGRIVQLRVPQFGQSGGFQSPSYTVRVYADDGTLRSGQTAPLLLLGGASVLLVALGIALGELLTRRIVRPLVNTSETAQRLAAGDVTARATTSGPAEVADVGRALNRLADRIDQLIEEERETVADLSHRLRTPMTALRLDAEALRDPADAERVGVHVSNLERMLTAVIRAARRPQREGRLPSSDATAVVGERVEFWSALAEDQGRAVSVELPGGPVVVRAGAEDLAAAVDALLENVIAHTPEGTDFAVALLAESDGGVLTISDDGPGLPPDAHVRGRSDRGSSGLGLDIARRCAESSGGTMTLGRSGSGGALVTLTLGAVD